ncbi:MAG: type II secretion system protein [Deinococcaceae bacterium]
MTNSKALTLIETLIALALLGIAILIMGGVANSFTSIRSSQKESLATNYARTVMDATVNLWQKNEFYKANLLPANLEPPPNGYSVTLNIQSDGVAASKKSYTLTCAASTCGFGTATASSPEAKHVEVVVKDSTGQEMASLRTLVSQPIPD